LWRGSFPAYPFSRLKALLKPAGPFQPRPGEPDQPFRSHRAGTDFQSDRFSSHKGFRVTRNALKKSFGVTCARIASAKRTAFIVACTKIERR
jgi:hypothetical protein